ncbi:myo-inositol-1(or 4)-monophosphatase [Sediminihabitans luteus]|uniref:Inositol-1-monophosphatase n=1 Tax=Sediminihabitans luteus TaxID=1138585 RepID=A0A2M9CQA1_9CELL|nr:inositol monophosphatase family protein [Sediminihabitans luteus]PJJ74084.1 myo-inositol-1(or 4)-monophosphatase [Sediminihabitans luteus]GII98001.1 putative inositol-1-monophosphatase SuhB [Sediminihabitans luteus]
MAFIDDPRIPPGTTVDDLRALAVRLATEAGSLVREGRPDTVEVAATKSSAVDVVTQMDADSEALLRRVIASERPDDAVLGEEDGHSTGGSGLTWVVDPIDGTVNYLYGVGPHAVSVAVVVGEPDPTTWTVLAGAVHCVNDGRTWSAGLGAGATLDGRPVRVNDPRPLAESLCGTGFGYAAERRAAQAAVLVEVLPRVRDIRRLGSAAVDLCLVASGALDVYYERGLNPWDMAAGLLVVEEAGGVVRGLHGRPATGEMTVAGPRETVAALVSVLEDAGADQGA